MTHQEGVDKLHDKLRVWLAFYALPKDKQAELVKLYPEDAAKYELTGDK